MLFPFGRVMVCNDVILLIHDWSKLHMKIIWKVEILILMILLGYLVTIILIIVITQSCKVVSNLKANDIGHNPIYMIYNMMECITCGGDKNAPHMYQCS